MLIDFSQESLFSKTNKTAGMSIEIALSKFMDDANSIITPITAEDESIRIGVGGKGPCGYQRIGLCQEARDTLLQSGGAEFCEFYIHISYQEVVEFLGALSLRVSGVLVLIGTPMTESSRSIPTAIGTSLVFPRFPSRST